MQPQHSHRHSRINLADLKAQMAKKLGLEASKQYFHCLNRFLSLKLTKIEFSKLCFRIIGRDNIPLHNQLICSILRNACSAKSPPTGSHVSANGYQPNGLLNGGDVLPLSPRKARTGLRRTGAHRMSKRPVATELDTRLENGKAELLFRDDVKEGSTRSPLRAPLGVRFCPISTHGVQRAIPAASSSRLTCTIDNLLPDNLTLRDRMDQISVSQGLEGASLDSAIVLNLGLDSYMKRLIGSCIELMGARSKKDTGNHHQQMTQSISFRDFRVTMESNPQKLGTKWPLLLEKICTQSFEEWQLSG